MCMSNRLFTTLRESVYPLSKYGLWCTDNEFLHAIHHVINRAAALKILHSNLFIQLFFKWFSFNYGTYASLQRAKER